MTASELKNIRGQVRLDIKSMAIVCGIPYRTYQDYELGNRGISENNAKKILVALDYQLQIKRDIMKTIDKLVDRDFPGGIPSEKEFDNESER